MEPTLEQQLVAWLRERLPPSPLAPLGLSDDAAVLELSESDRRLVVTVDAVSDLVDFKLDEIDPRQAGHKALGVNLSDLAAMAAEPVAAVVALVLPRSGAAGRSALELAKGLYEGMLALAERFNLALVGGDTNVWDAPLAISVTAIGRTTTGGPLTRGGAKPGNVILVTGALGGSILGRHLAVEPRLREASLLTRRYGLTAGMDISDGLALDASRLADASGCGIALDLTTIPISADAHRLATTTCKTALEHALGDGEDFELLVTTSPATAEAIVRDQPLGGVPITAIGVCVPEPGLWQRDATGRLKELPASGYLHQ